MYAYIVRKSLAILCACTQIVKQKCFNWRLCYKRYLWGGTRIVHFVLKKMSFFSCVEWNDGSLSIRTLFSIMSVMKIDVGGENPTCIRGMNFVIKLFYFSSDHLQHTHTLPFLCSIEEKWVSDILFSPNIKKRDFQQYLPPPPALETSIYSERLTPATHDRVLAEVLRDKTVNGNIRKVTWPQYNTRHGRVASLIIFWK